MTPQTCCCFARRGLKCVYVSDDVIEWTKPEHLTDTVTSDERHLEITVYIKLCSSLQFSLIWQRSAHTNTDSSSEITSKNNTNLNLLKDFSEWCSALFTFSVQLYQSWKLCKCSFLCSSDETLLLCYHMILFSILSSTCVECFLSLLNEWHSGRCRQSLWGHLSLGASCFTILSYVIRDHPGCNVSGNTSTMEILGSPLLCAGHDWYWRSAWMERLSGYSRCATATGLLLWSIGHHWRSVR